MEYNQLLENKKQIILQGPPGTGKTYTAQDMAYQLIFNEEISQESIQRKKDLIKLTESEYFDLVQFHPSYTYEDFVRGINVETNDGQISYKTKNKVFGDLIERANRNYDNSQKGTNELKEDQKPEEYLTNKGEDKQAIIQEKKFVLIIDEINRANLPSVLGELIYALEYRGVPVNGMYKYKGSRSLIVPPNIYIIGTMNTADRSVGHIDYAIRRRFSFVDILPNEEVIKDPDAKKLFNEVKALFMDGVLATDFDRKDVQLGHSYFMVKNKNELKDKFKYEILPILSEYIKDGILLKKAEDILIEIEQNVL
jgi:5-methylcytosine-specific restriction protein B